MMFVSSSARFAAVLAGLALLSTPALAQGTADERSACIGDAFRFCGSDIPNVSKIEACLIQNISHISTGCREEFRRPPEGKTKLKPEHFNS